MFIKEDYHAYQGAFTEFDQKYSKRALLWNIITI